MTLCMKVVKKEAGENSQEFGQWMSTNIGSYETRRYDEDVP